MTIQSNLTTQILDAHINDVTGENIIMEDLWGMKKLLEITENSASYLMNRILVPKFHDTRELLMNEAHKTRYSINPGANKIYLDLKKLYWWSNMKA